LIWFESIQYYYEFDLIYLWKKGNKRYRISVYNLDAQYIPSLRFPRKFPKEYKNCYGEGKYIIDQLPKPNELVENNAIDIMESKNI
jgi:hypothetical protein